MGVSPSPSPLMIFCGKGGVGKTTLSLALGLRHARAGRSVLVVSSHPLRELAVSISLSGLKDRYPEAVANLFIVHIDPREILGNKVRQQIPSEFLARTVLSSRLYQNLIEVAPGLKELAFLARLRQLAEGKSQDGETHRYDLMIWDTPATGHFLQTLKVSRNFDTYLSGPFAVLGKELVDFLSDPRKIKILPVTILEEMSVDETIEMCGELKDELGMAPAALICNLASPLLSSPEEVYQQVCDGFAVEGAGFAEFKFMLDRHAVERQLFQRLCAAVPAAPCIVGRVPRYSSDLELLDGLAAALGRNLMDVA
jgi:anion-transporting  ArsA/GET3 family ATPase